MRRILSVGSRVRKITASYRVTTLSPHPSIEPDKTQAFRGMTAVGTPAPLALAARPLDACRRTAGRSATRSSRRHRRAVPTRCPRGLGRALWCQSRSRLSREDEIVASEHRASRATPALAESPGVAWRRFLPPVRCRRRSSFSSPGGRRHRQAGGQRPVPHTQLGMRARRSASHAGPPRCGTLTIHVTAKTGRSLCRCSPCRVGGVSVGTQQSGVDHLISWTTDARPATVIARLGGDRTPTVAASVASAGGCPHEVHAAHNRQNSSTTSRP